MLNNIERQLKSIVHDQYSELQHYTDWGGLNGILESGELWSTRYDQLNDMSEIIHFKQMFEKGCGRTLSNIFRKIEKSNRELSRQIKRCGGPNVAGLVEARRMIKILYDEMYQPESALAVPYITSLCAHQNNGYECENGLLSQWRGYSSQDIKNGRFSIVFDSKKLSDLLIEERALHHYSYFELLNVHYNTADFDFDEKFADVVIQFERFYRQNNESNLEQLFELMTSATSRLKHQGFQEEREIRVVACPLDTNYLEKLKKVYGASTPNLRAKKIQLLNGKIRIKLFDWEDRTSLPIRRIIVGPHPDQEKIIDNVKRLAAGRVKVTKSITPFIG